MPQVLTDSYEFPAGSTAVGAKFNGTPISYAQGPNGKGLVETNIQSFLVQLPADVQKAFAQIGIKPTQTQSVELSQ